MVLYKNELYVHFVYDNLDHVNEIICFLFSILFYLKKPNNYEIGNPWGPGRPNIAFHNLGDELPF